MTASRAARSRSRSAASDVSCIFTPRLIAWSCVIGCVRRRRVEVERAREIDARRFAGAVAHRDGEIAQRLATHRIEIQRGEAFRASRVDARLRLLDLEPRAGDVRIVRERRGDCRSMVSRSPAFAAPGQRRSSAATTGRITHLSGRRGSR